MASLTRVKDVISDPKNRPAFSLLFKTTIAMVLVPLATFYACYNYLLASGGFYDLSGDLNMRVNVSGFVSLASVQVCIWRIL